MPVKEREKILIVEHIFELRHDASGSFIDMKGYIADYVRDNEMFLHWRIDPNLVSFFDANDHIEKEGAFIGYKSISYVVYNPDTRNYFPDRTRSFLKKFFQNNRYTIPKKLSRFGMRTKIFFPSEKTFEEINRIVFNVFYAEKVKELIGGKEKDVQFVFDLREEQFDLRLAGGPIHQNEVGNYFSFKSKHFENSGFFLDVDYSKSHELTQDSIPNLISKSVELMWSMVGKFENQLGI